MVRCPRQAYVATGQPGVWTFGLEGVRFGSTRLGACGTVHSLSVVNAPGLLRPPRAPCGGIRGCPVPGSHVGGSLRFVSARVAVGGFGTRRDWGQQFGRGVWAG